MTAVVFLFLFFQSKWVFFGFEKAVCLSVCLLAFIREMKGALL